MDLKKIKAVLLDLDGTLANSLPVLYEVYLEFLHHFQLEGSLEEFSELIGMSLREVSMALEKRYNLNNSEDELYQLYIRSLENHYTHKIELFAGAREFIDYIYAQGLKIALVTSADEDLAKRFLEAQHIFDKFTYIITARDLPRDKPAPDIYLKALKTLNLQRKEAVAIEDSASGLKSALGAQVPVIWIAHNKNIVEKPHLMRVEDWKHCLRFFEEERDDASA